MQKSLKALHIYIVQDNDNLFARRILIYLRGLPAFNANLNLTTIMASTTARVVREVVPQALGLNDDLFDDEIELPDLPVAAGTATPQALVPTEAPPEDEEGIVAPTISPFSASDANRCMREAHWPLASS